MRHSIENALLDKATLPPFDERRHSMVKLGAQWKPRVGDVVRYSYYGISAPEIVCVITRVRGDEFLVDYGDGGSAWWSDDSRVTYLHHHSRYYYDDDRCDFVRDENIP